MGGLFEFFTSDSESSSSTSQTTNTTDQRTIADNQGIAVGANASYINSLPDNALQLFEKLFDFSSGVVSKAFGVSESAVMGQQITANKAQDQQTQIASQAQLGNASIISQNAPLLIFVAAGVIIFLAIRKKV